MGVIASEELVTDSRRTGKRDFLDDNAVNEHSTNLPYIIK